MTRLASRMIRAALESEFPGQEPSPKVWEAVRGAIPQMPANRRPRTLRVAVAAASVLLVSMAGVSAASTPQGQEALQWVRERFGMELVPRSPELRKQWEEKGAKVTKSEPVDADKLRERLPKAMKLPTYIPEGVQGGQLMVNYYGPGAIVTWTQANRQVLVDYHEAVSRNTVMGISGAARDVQEVRVGNLPGFTYLDDKGWNLYWAMDGHQYGVVTNLTLEEAIKVAESIR